MSSITGLKRADGQRLPVSLAAICAPCGPVLQLGAIRPNAALRAVIANTFALLGLSSERAQVGVRPLMIDSGGRRIEARLYEPDGIGGGSALLVFFHGGGWVVGNMASHDGLCRQVALRAGCRVLSVEYSLAPEHRFPNAFEDALASYRWALARASELRCDPARVAVGGDSAGGNLAAAVALHAGDAPPCFAWLLYPVCDANSSLYASTELFRRGPLLTSKAMDAFLDHYAPDVRDHLDPRLSVVLSESLASMPPTFIATAGMDILRDQGQAFAARLREAGVDVDARCFRNLPHGFASVLVEPHARAACFESITALTAGLAVRESAAA